MTELHRPIPTSFHEAMRLGAIIRVGVMGLGDQSWQPRHIGALFMDGTLEAHYLEYWDKWTRPEKEEIIRRWTIYKMES